MFGEVRQPRQTPLKDNLRHTYKGRSSVRYSRAGCSSINIPHKKGILHLLAINGRAVALSSSSTPAPNQQLVNLQMNTSPRFIPSAHVARRDFQSNDAPSFRSSLILSPGSSLFVPLDVSHSSESEDGGMFFFIIVISCSLSASLSLTLNKIVNSSLIFNLLTSTHSLTNRIKASTQEDITLRDKQHGNVFQPIQVTSHANTNPHTNNQTELIPSRPISA